MHRTAADPATPTRLRVSRSVRDALQPLSLPPAEAETACALVRDALTGQGRARREAEARLLAGDVEDGGPPLAVGERPAPPARWIPLVLALRDELRREEPPPRGLARRVDALLVALSGGAGGAPASADGGPDEDAAPRPAGSGGGTRRRRRDEVRARALLGPLLDLCPDGVLTLCASGGLGRWNRSGVALIGRRRRDLARRGPATLFRDPDELPRLLRELEEAGRLAPRETTLLAAGGRDVPVRVLGARLGRDGAAPAEDDPERIVLLFHDLTEMQSIRRRLIETENLSAMAKIAGSVAHEFRNPLNSLFLSADLLEDELAGSGALQESIAPTLAAIREEIERLNQIITHYLSLSKVASHAPEVVDLGRAVQRFADQWQDPAADRGVDLRVRLHDGDARVSVDPNQLRRVLVNLVENAFDAVGDAGEEDGPEAGEPDAEGAEARPGAPGQEARDRTRPGVVTLVVRPMRRVVKLTVRDNGPGIPEAIRERVLEPFFTSKARGSGLGLYLVREIVLAHGGSLSLGSSGVRGTSVAIRWPRPHALPGPEETTP
jgi:signal transduction histidine kinase